jgi:WD40 repeat protein
MSSGKFLRELRPFEQGTCEAVRGPFWSPDGRYLLAATKSDSLFTSEGISVWNAQSGRHRGEFTGCPSHVIGAALLPRGGQLAAGCSDGKIRFWDFPAAMKQIRSFEDSLPDR